MGGLTLVKPYARHKYEQIKSNILLFLGPQVDFVPRAKKVEQTIHEFRDEKQENKNGG